MNPTDEPLAFEKLLFVMHDLICIDQDLTGLKTVAYENLGENCQQIDREDDRTKERYGEGFEGVKSVLNRLEDQL